MTSPVEIGGLVQRACAPERRTCCARSPFRTPSPLRGSRTWSAIGPLRSVHAVDRKNERDRFGPTPGGRVMIDEAVGVDRDLCPGQPKAGFTPVEIRLRVASPAHTQDGTALPICLALHARRAMIPFAPCVVTFDACHNDLPSVGFCFPDRRRPPAGRIIDVGRGPASRDKIRASVLRRGLNDCADVIGCLFSDSYTPMRLRAQVS